MRNVAIIGSGPAGYTAAIYVARAGLKPVLFTSAVTVGGELMNTTDVENFPGFPEGILGPDLMQKFQDQATRFGTELVFDDVESVELTGTIKKISTAYSGDFEALAVILATGSAYRHLNVPGEERLSGRGISWCATCDGAFFREQHIAVVGGGDSAMEEALFLTRFADRVTIIHRSDQFRASQIMLERARANEKIDWLPNTKVLEYLGETKLTGLKLENTLTGAAFQREFTGTFVAIGHDPRTELFKGQIELTETGVVQVAGRSSRTSLPGVFAAGDVIDDHYRQAITAAGSGTVAALDVEAYLGTLSPELLAQVSLDTTDTTDTTDTAAEPGASSEAATVQPVAAQSTAFSLDPIGFNAPILADASTLSASTPSDTALPSDKFSQK